MNRLDPLGAVTADHPYPYYARLTAERPFFYDAASRMWVASSVEAVESTLSSPAMRVRPSSEPIPRAIISTPQADIFRRLVRMTDGPSQIVLKDAVCATLDPLDLIELATTTERCARRLVVASSDDDGLDVDAYVSGLSAFVIAATLGLSGDDALRSIAWTRSLVRSIVPGATADDVASGRSPAVALRRAMTSLAVASDRGSMLSTFIAAGRSRGIDDAVLSANAVGFLIQSYDACCGLIGNVLRMLAAVPRALHDAVADDHALLARMVEETARYDAPIQNTRRFVAFDTTIGNARVREGDTILVVLAAANRDTAANTEPHCFDAERTSRRTYSFGIGTHACPGATIATTIVRVGVLHLLRTTVGIDMLRLGGYRPLPNARVPHFGLTRLRVVR